MPITRDQLRGVVPCLSEVELDRLCGAVFATPAGRDWLVYAELHAPEHVAAIRIRLRRCREAWGDRTGPRVPLPSSIPNDP